MKITIRPLTPSRWPDLEALFGRNGACNGCWCMYWRIGPEYHKRPYGSLLRKRLGDRAAWDYSGSTASATGLLIVYGEPGARLKLVGVTVNTKSLLALALSA
jgi:hypothetical protein